MTKTKKKKRQYKRFFHRLLVLLVLCALGYGIIHLIYLFIQPIVLNYTSITMEVDSKYDPTEALKYVFLGEKDQVTISGEVDTSKAGDYTIIFRYKSKERNLVAHVEDHKAPKLKLKNITTDTISKVKVTDFIKSVKDNSKVSLSMNSDDSKKAGVYDVTITATDEYGNETTKSCILRREKDKIAPKFKKMDSLTITINETDAIKDVKVTDNLDPNPEVDIDDSDVNYSKEGTYKVIYTATDRSGNSTTKKRKVKVVGNDTEKYEKIVYLTFDDGPSENTEKILDILKENDAKATFFVTGNGQDYNDAMKKAYDQGNTIGLHSYSHDYSIYKSKKAYFKDLNQIQDLVEEVTGEKSYIIRFPGGSSNTISDEYSENIMDTLEVAVEEKGYEYYDWSVDSQDASSNDVSVDDIVSAATSSSENYINILMHDSGTKSTTVEALPKIIKYYKKKGYTFLPITKGSVLVQHENASQATETDSSESIDEAYTYDESTMYDDSYAYTDQVQ